jgi:hypothetical protein
MKSQIKEIKSVYKGLQTLYGTYLPKVDPYLIDDLLMRQQQQKKNKNSPNIAAPFYMVEAFTKPGTDSEAKRSLIFEKTGMIPAVYDNGTHYAANHRLTLEMLKEISNDEDVLEVTGEYTGGVTGRGASHERKHDNTTTYNTQNYYNNNTHSSKLSSSSMTLLQQLQQETTTEKEAKEEQKEEQQKTNATNIDKLLEIKTVYKGLQTLFETYLPKADPVLIHDLLVREEQQNPKAAAPFYMVEAFTKPGTDSEAVRNKIIEKTSMVPAIYDKGTHYVTNHRLTLEMLKEISDVEYIVEVTGEYTGGITARGASHEHLDMNDYF